MRNASVELSVEPPIPVGLWIFSLICDPIRLAGDSDEAWSTVALFLMIGGFVGAPFVAVPGFIPAVPGTGDARLRRRCRGTRMNDAEAA